MNQTNSDRIIIRRKEIEEADITANELVQPERSKGEKPMERQATKHRGLKIIGSIAIGALIIFAVIGVSYFIINDIMIRDYVASRLVPVNATDKIEIVTTDGIGEGWYRVDVSIMNLTTGNILDGTLHYNANTKAFADLPPFIMLKPLNNSTG
jgi:hypothetical protein